MNENIDQNKGRGRDGKKIVLSGIRATGNLHLGNYFGALSKFVRMQDDYDCRYFVADLHALTTHPDPAILHENVKDILAEYLAAGLHWWPWTVGRGLKRFGREVDIRIRNNCTGARGGPGNHPGPFCCAKNESEEK